MGYVSDQHLADLYRGATGLVFPSISEGFGLPPLEAMALGCPVITSRMSVMPEVCGDAPLYADVADAAEFGRAVEALEKQPELRQVLIQKGKRQAARFTWRTAAEELLVRIENARTALRKPGRQKGSLTAGCR